MVRVIPHRSEVAKIVLRCNLMLAELVGMRSRLMAALMVGLVLLAFACSTEPEPEPAATGDASVLAVATPTPSIEPTQTPAPEPTETPEPTSSPTETPVPSPGAVRNLRVAGVTVDSITLQWDPPENSDAVPVARYEVTRDVLGSDEHNFVIETTFTDVGLREGTEHKYRVRAIGSEETEGKEVNVEASTLESPTPEPPQAPEPTATSAPLTATPEPTSTPAPTLIPEPTATSAPLTATPEPTSTPAPTLIPEPTATSVPLTPTPKPTSTSVPPTPTPLQVATWRGLSIAAEHRCSEYDSGDYSYSQSVEQRIVAGMGDIIYGPYTGTWFASTGDTDIEHIVARSEAHDSGLCMADAGTRKAFASDLLNLTLASETVNRHQKVANDAAEWLPDLNQCWYADRVVQVRAKYNLTVDQREADALNVVLSGCTSFEMVVVPASSQTPPPPTSTPGSGSGSGVDVLALYDDNNNGRITCKEARAHGIAPVHSDHPAYPYMNDADGDGVVCE